MRGKGFQQRLRVISILDTMHHLSGQDFHPHRGALLQPARERPGYEKVEAWSKWASLAHPRRPLGRRRYVAINHGTGNRVGK
jgi:hypothetical protein